MARIGSRLNQLENAVADAQISEDKRPKEDMVTTLIHSLLSLPRRMQIHQQIKYLDLRVQSHRQPQS